MAWVTKDSQETYEDKEPERTYTKAEKAGNWWHYHKWQVVVIVVVLAIVGTIAKDILFTTRPDYQVGYVGVQELPEDTVTALKTALASFCDDRNGDGKVVVQINQYAIDLSKTTADTAESAEKDTSDPYVRMALMTRLTSDISSSDGSYIFLLEDPESFQANTEALRYLDGTVPDQDVTATDWQNMVYRWTDCPVLTGLDLGTYTGYTMMDDTTGSNQDVLGKLYVGCRGTWTDKTEESYAQDDVLWQKLTQGAVSTAGQD